MNDDNYNEETSCLNSVNITSNVRAPGEYKYYYCGENNSSSDKSFLSFSTMWYTTKISEEKFLLSSCYTELYTAFIYYCPIKSLYNIYVYKNIIDYKSENVSLKPIQLIHLDPIYKPKDIIISKNDTNGMPNINITVKIYFGADNYLLINEVDKRIILIDFFNGNFITLFNNKETKSQEPLYNIIDTFDENYFSEGEEKVRTYAFLSIKYQEKKLSYYKYRYFIIERDILENNYFFLHQIDLDMGNGEPLGLKIARIPKMKKNNNDDIDDKNSDKEEKRNHQWFFVFCFLSNQRLFELVTNYNRLSLYQVLRMINQCQTKKIENSKSGKCSMTTVGYFKKEESKNLEKNLIESIYNDFERDKNQVNNKPFFWSTSIILWLEKKQVAQSVKIFLNINTKRLCALILFFEIGYVASFPFNYNDSPEEIKNKITITLNEIQLDKITTSSFGDMAKVYQFEEHYFFKSNTICALSYKYLVLAIDNKIRIYDLETNQNLFKYTFYKENINSFMLFNNLGFTFMMTWTKIFKIIFTTRLQLFSEKRIIHESKLPINSYEPNGLNYPLFEYRPEDIWNSYLNNLEKDSQEIKRGTVRKNTVGSNSDKKENEKKEEKKIKYCEICSKEAEYCCSDCELKYYCSQEHFIYDYNNIHFFECQLVQFFKRKDIINRENREQRYLILYNELIKLCGRILNYIFTRIFVAKDCHLYLEMLLNLITLLDNFGFNINYSEFCSVNLFPTNDKQKPEKVLFFQECIYYYAQLQLLKCTFTSKSKLYNLTDCYLKIIKNDIIPKLTPKTNKRIIALRCDKLKKKNILNNPFFQKFESSIFFNLKKTYYNSEFLEAFDSKKFYYPENNDAFDIIENYLMKHLMALSILAKFKIKLNSSIDVKDIFVDITLMFDYHFRENKTTKNIVPYCYFSISFYLVEIGKVPQTVKLLKKMVSSFTEKTETKLKALTYYNLGILQYALGEFKIGIHNLEISYKQFVDNSLSEKFKQRAMFSLGLAYLNQPNLFKAYVLIQKLISELKKIKKQKLELRCIKLSVYLNYIIDLYEYSFITKSRIQSNKPKNNNYYNSRQLVSFVEGGTDKELVVIEQHVLEFLKVVEYIWNLKPQVLQHLQTDNPPKQTNNYREEVHHEKNSSFTMETSQMSTFLMRETGIEKEESQEEYDEDIEVKPSLYDSLTRQQQKDFKELKTSFLKRDIVLRDSLGIIEKFNINYDPLYSPQFQKIIEKLKSNFLLKEIFYCFQNEKWRDELYNYSPNNVLFGLSKYLKLEKIKNVIAIEKSKCLDKIRKEKKENNNLDLLALSIKETDTLKKINTENSIYPNNVSNLLLNNSSFSLNVVNNRYKTENLNYIDFKKKFIDALKDSDKNKKKFNESSPYLNLKEDYLVNLYKNVYLNNPEHDFIFQNPSLILNYIFIDISNSGENTKKEENDLILKQKLEEENETNNMASFKRNRKISNTDLIKPDEKLNNKISLKNYIGNKSKKNLNDIFNEKGQLIISPLLENMQEKNENIESSSESIGSIEYTYCYLKFEEKDLIIVEREVEYTYHFEKKKRESCLKKLKKKILKKRTEIPDIFNKNHHGKYSLDDDNDDIELDPNRINKNINFSLSKKDKSSTNLREKTGKFFGIKLIEYETSDEFDDNNNKKRKKSIYEKANKTHIDNYINETRKDESNNFESNEKSKSISKQENINNEIIKDNNNINNRSRSVSEKIQLNEEENKKDINNNSDNIENLNVINKKDEIKDSKNFIENKKDYFDIKYFDFLNENEQKTKETKENNKKILNKNKSVKQFNYNKKKIIERAKNNRLTTKKTQVLIKPKTYNYFSPEELKQELINNNKPNKKNIERNINKNYGYKNKTEQEIELVNGAIEYLKNEIKNGITNGPIKKKYIQLYENNNKIKNRNNNNAPKYKEKKGDESTMSLTLTSSEIIYNKNSNNSGDASTNNDNSSSSNRFKKEMNRIMKYNKKLITNEKNNRNGIKHNNIIYNSLKQNLRNNKVYNNKRMKKSLSQINLYDKRLEKTENEKTAYSKNKTRSFKYCSPIDNQKSIYLFNNKSINNNNSKNSSNYTKFNNNNNNNNFANSNKFRFVLDKYIIKQKNTRNKNNYNNNKNNNNKKLLNKNKKVEEKSRNNIENEDQKLKIPKNSGINKYDFDKKENSKMITTKKNEENILSNVDNNRKKEQTNEFNDVTNIKYIKESEIIFKNSNESNNIEDNEEKIDTLCNNLGSKTNIKGLINLPFYITPKYSNNVSNIDSLNKIKSSSNSGNNSSYLRKKRLNK